MLFRRQLLKLQTLSWDPCIENPALIPEPDIRLFTYASKQPISTKWRVHVPTFSYTFPCHTQIMGSSVPRKRHTPILTGAVLRKGAGKPTHTELERVQTEKEEPLPVQVHTRTERARDENLTALCAVTHDGQLFQPCTAVSSFEKPKNPKHPQ